MRDIIYIVGVDGSEYSNRAAERAFNLAKTVGAKVLLVVAAQWSDHHPLYIKDVSPPAPEDKSKEEKLERQKLLEPLEEKYRDYGVKFSSEIIWGSPADVLREKAKSTHANMVFLGRRGRSQAIDLIFGSVASKVAHKAGIPVVLVP